MSGDDYEAREQVAWNIAADQAKHISNLIKRGIEFYLRGNSGECYWTFTGIKILINCELKDEEKDELKGIEKKANKLLPGWEKYRRTIKDGITPNDELKKSRNEFSGNVKRYMEKIMDLLKDLGYLPNKEDRTHLTF